MTPARVARGRRRACVGARRRRLPAARRLPRLDAARRRAARACATWRGELARHPARASPCSATTTGARRGPAMGGRCATAGVRVLENAAVECRTGCWVAGLADLRHRSPDLAAALRGRARGCAVLLLARTTPTSSRTVPRARRADASPATSTAGRSTCRSCACASCPRATATRYLARPRGRGRPSPVRLDRPRHRRAAAAAAPAARRSRAPDSAEPDAPSAFQPRDVLVGQAARPARCRTSSVGPRPSGRPAPRSWRRGRRRSTRAAGPGRACASIAASFQWRVRARDAREAQMRPAARESEQARQVLLRALLPARAPDALERRRRAALSRAPASGQAVRDAVDQCRHESPEVAGRFEAEQGDARRRRRSEQERRLGDVHRRSWTLGCRRRRSSSWARRWGPMTRGSRGRTAGRQPPRRAATPITDFIVTLEPRHPARARLRHRHAARLPLQAQGRQRGAPRVTSAIRCAPAARCSPPSGSRSAWPSRPAPGSSTSPRWRFAPLSVVQAVLSTGVVILAVLAERIFGFKVGAAPVARRRDDRARPAAARHHAARPAHGAHSAYSLAGMISFEAGMLAIGALLISGPRLGAPDHHHGVMLGAAAGVLFGVSDVAIKALTGARRLRRRRSSRPGWPSRSSPRSSPSTPRPAACRTARPSRSSPRPPPPPTSPASSAASSSSATRCPRTRSASRPGLRLRAGRRRRAGHAAAGARRGRQRARLGRRVRAATRCDLLGVVPRRDVPAAGQRDVPRRRERRAGARALRAVEQQPVVLAPRRSSSGRSVGRRSELAPRRARRAAWRGSRASGRGCATPPRHLVRRHALRVPRRSAHEVARRMPRAPRERAGRRRRAPARAPRGEAQRRERVAPLPARGEARPARARRPSAPHPCARARAQRRRRASCRPRAGARRPSSADEAGDGARELRDARRRRRAAAATRRSPADRGRSRRARCASWSSTGTHTCHCEPMPWIRTSGGPDPRRWCERRMAARAYGLADSAAPQISCTDRRNASDEAGGDGHGDGGRADGGRDAAGAGASGTCGCTSRRMGAFDEAARSRSSSAARAATSTTSTASATSTGSSALFCVNIGHGRAERRPGRRRPGEGARLLHELDLRAPEGDRARRARSPSSRPATSTACSSPRGGSEAVDSALKLCRQYHKLTGNPGRYKVISRKLAYHGTTMGALTATGIPPRGAPFEPLFPGSAHVPNTNLYRARGRRPGRGDPRADRVRGPGDRRGVILEPVQNSGGCFVAAGRLLPARARDLRRVRGPAHLRRGHLRVGPARRVVRRRALRLPARHHHDGQGPDLRRTRRWAR